MPQIVFVEPSGARRTVEAAVGASVMRAAISNDIEGILAECGGAAACATCHVFIAPRPGMPAPVAMENDMLDATAVPRQAESRLSCQVFVTADMDGMVVHIPEMQL